MLLITNLSCGSNSMTEVHRHLYFDGESSGDATTTHGQKIYGHDQNQKKEKKKSPELVTVFSWLLGLSSMCLTLFAFTTFTLLMLTVEAKSSNIIITIIQIDGKLTAIIFLYRTFPKSRKFGN